MNERAWSAVVVVCLVASWSGCGGSTPKGGKDGAAGDATGHAGTGGTAGSGRAGSGGAGAGGAAGATDGGVDVANDAPSDTPATDAPVDGVLDGADAVADAAPPRDVGALCVPPSGEPALSPAVAGLPSTGLVLWLRGDRGVYKAGADAVCAWADQSGHDLILTSVSTRPTWTAAGLGGQPALHYTLATDVLATGGVLGLAPTSARTIVAVSTLVATTKRFDPVYQGKSGSPGTYLGIDSNTFLTAGSREGVYCMNNAYDTALATAATPRVHVYTLATMTPGQPVLSNVDYRVNGATQTLTRTPGGLGNGNFEDFSAADYTSVGGGAEAFIAEVLVYDRALSADERVAIETALKTRYAIP